MLYPLEVLVLNKMISQKSYTLVAQVDRCEKTIMEAEELIIASNNSENYKSAIESEEAIDKEINSFKES